MRFFLLLLFFFALANSALAQNTEDEGIFNLNKNPFAPGSAPVSDPRLAPTKETGGIILPQENSDLPKEAAIVFGDKKKQSPISKDYIFGFISGSVLIAFVSFFMLKFAKHGG